MICLKSPKSSEFTKRKSTNSGQEALTMLISSFLTTVQLIFKNREIRKIKSYASGGMRTATPGF